MTSARKQFCAYKLDLSKAYDRGDWEFLEKALIKIGFCEQWVHWVMICVTTVQYSVYFNGTLLEPFSPSRGLPQGDPLSPYLFLFVAKGLSCILNHEVENNRLGELKICPGPALGYGKKCDGLGSRKSRGPNLACPEQAVIVHQALKKYQDYTGQLLSPAKCSLLSSAHCPDDTLDEIKAILQIQTSTFEAKYLGLPTPEGRMSADRFKSISERLAKRMNSWSEKFMSSGAKEVLIKSVAQAIPTYMMGVFKLPASTCDVYTKMIRDFWWGDDENKRKVHWIAWENLVLPKGLGGLGFRDLRLFNQALLGRQAWRLIQYLESLCARILKAKYYPNSELIDAVFPVDSSPSWKGIEHGLHLLKKGLVWRIGDGSKVNIWRDQWIPKESAFKPMGRSRCRLRWVSQLMVPREKCWDEELIRHVCYPHDAEDILKIKIMQFPVEDFPAWHYERTDQTRNNCRHQRKSSVPVSLQSKLKEEEAPVRVNIKWKAPPIGWAKVNVDGAYVAATGKAGAGIIIRNHMGEVLLSSWRTIKNCGSAEEADQAVSCRDGIRLLVEWVKMPMILETDCANIGRAMVNTGDDRSIPPLAGDS
uniref:Retrotransposon protein, putative, unclassified, expressed n=2 Tax=Oryza sativa subsp. japonica TaxID=39947 RepID=Q2QNW5_ORYSJ|nr:retrotransposon protein, putative, unclassified, expressed [Oryza sativa Japonica Group]